MSTYHTKDVMHFTDVTLLVKDIKRSLHFYQEILLLKVLSAEDHKAVLSQNGKTAFITLIEDAGALPGGRSLGLYHFAILLSSRARLAHILKRFVDTGYPLTGASDHGVSEALYLDDPDGNGIEIYADRNPSTWPRKNDQVEMFTKPMDIQGVMTELPKEPYTEFDPTAVMGHLHFHVGNLNLGQAFYQDIIGFQLILNYGGSAIFVSDAGYHHHLGFNIWNRSGRLRGEHESGLMGYGLFVPKAHLTEFKTRLTDHQIELKEENKQLYFIDHLNQKVIVHTA